MTVGPCGTLVVVGAGGFGRETVEAVRALNADGARWALAGYIDDQLALRGAEVDGLPVLGDISELEKLPNTKVVVCTGRPDNYTSRPSIIARLQLPPERYATIIHPSASVSSTSRVGHGSVLLASVTLTAAVTVGSHVAVMPQVTFTHDDVVADFATVASAASLGGSVHIGECAYIGAGALIRERCHVGAGALVGMGAVVTRDVPAAEVWAGIPASFVRKASLPVGLTYIAGSAFSEAT